MAQQLQLSGRVQSLYDQGIVDGLRRRVSDLETELSLAHSALHRNQQELGETVAKLERAKDTLDGIRHQLNPFYSSLQVLFGDIERVVGNRATSAQDSAPDDRKRKIWQSWISKLPGVPARFISALLEHGTPMTAQQLRVAIHCGQQAVYDAASKLGKLGLLTKGDGKYSLKEL